MFFAGEGTCGSLVWMLAEGGFGNSFALGLCTSAWGQQEQFAGAQPTELLSRGVRAKRSRAVRWGTLFCSPSAKFAWNQSVFAHATGIFPEQQRIWL